MKVDEQLSELVEAWGGRRSSVGSEPMYIIPAKILERVLALAVGPRLYDEQAYLKEHVDIAEALSRKELISGLQHYLRTGLIENRNVKARDFSEIDYLKSYPDIKQAIDAGFIGSAYDHWVHGGWLEGRLPTSAKTPSE